MVCSTNAREITDPLMSWGDAHGGGLAFIALTLAGGAGHVIIPSTSGFASLSPHGSSPLVDPLYSTEALDLHHDAIARGRVGKVAWLAAQRPELLGLLKVCFAENRPDNCGRCGKCLFTMACLEAVGALGRADGFPDQIDLGAVAGMRHSTLSGRIDWCELWRAVPDGPLREAILISLRRTARPPLRERLRRRARGRPVSSAMSRSPDQFDRHWTNTAASLLMDGRPYP